MLGEWYFAGMIMLEYLKDSSIASIHFRPEPSEGARKMIEDAGRGNMIEVKASP